MPISLIVFDCDGILLESVEIKTNAFGRTVEKYGADAVNRLLEYHRMNGGVSRYEKFAWFYREVLGREITPEESKALGVRFKKLMLEGVMEAPMVPGALDCIKTFYGRIPMFVASGTPQDELTNILKARGLSGYFEGIRGTPPEKTDLLRGIIEETKKDPARTLMVGDSSTDLEAATACGTKFWGRGKHFADTGWPWDPDLLGLSKYLD